MIRRALYASALLLFSALSALAQNFPGQLPAFSILGNPTAAISPTQTPLTNVLFGNSSLAINVTSTPTTGCARNPGVRAPIYVCNDNNGVNAAGFALGWEVWIGNNPVGSIAANNAVATFVYIDNTNGRKGTWATNYVCNHLPVSAGGSVVQNHCQENDVLQSQAATTPLSAVNNQGPITHGYEAVCSQNTSASPFPCQAAIFIWAAGDYNNSGASQTQPFNFGVGASRIQFSALTCEVNTGDTGTYFKQGCIWDQSNSAMSFQSTGTHTSIVDASAATYTQFANCNVTCSFTGKVSSSGGIISNGNVGAIGLAASFVANAAVSGNSGIELQTVGITRGYLAVTGSLMELYTNAANPLHIGANNADAILISGTNVVQLPLLTTGTPNASVCVDASNNLIKKTTAGACI